MAKKREKNQKTPKLGANWTQEERDRFRSYLLRELYGEELAAHAKRVDDGEIPLMAGGPRGWGTMRRQMYGPEVRRARAMCRHLGITLPRLKVGK